MWTGAWLFGDVDKADSNPPRPTRLVYVDRFAHQHEMSREGSDHVDRKTAARHNDLDCPRGPEVYMVSDVGCEHERECASHAPQRDWSALKTSALAIPAAGMTSVNCDVCSQARPSCRNLCVHRFASRRARVQLTAAQYEHLFITSSWTQRPEQGAVHKVATMRRPLRRSHAVVRRT